MQKKKKKEQLNSVRHTTEEFYAYQYQIHSIQTEKKKKRFNYEITARRKQK
jgi:hypothetical protein